MLHIHRTCSYMRRYAGCAYATAVLTRVMCVSLMWSHDSPVGVDVDGDVDVDVDVLDVCDVLDACDVDVDVRPVHTYVV